MSNHALITLVHDQGAKTETHIAGGCSDYATVCGVAVDGDEFSATVAKRQLKKITCGHCYRIWNDCRYVSHATFSSKAWS